MAAKPMPDQATLLKLLRYEPETGKLFWRERAPDMFCVTERTAEAACAAWNAHYANKEAITKLDTLGYRAGTVLYHQTRAHRVIWVMICGDLPDFIDHINGNRSDNRFCNLRSVTKSENNRNAAVRKDNTSGFAGVQWHAKSALWRASITIDSRVISLGYFRDVNAAGDARKAAERKYGFHPNHGRKGA